LGGAQYTAYNQDMVQAEHRPLRWLLAFPAVFAIVLISLESPAQGENETCPCFSSEEVESIFLTGNKLAAEGAVIGCNAEDYSVEIGAEVIIWDQDFATIAQASVKWYDFDPSRCDYIDTINNPGVERKVTWPHPAPKDTARACFDIISSVIAKSDTAGTCKIYP
jgi:hypothetical protein